MKIKRSVKKTPSSHPGIAQLIDKLVSCDKDEVAELVGSFVDSNQWPWPKTDLQHWINVLNKFDSLLEDVVKDYDLKSMQHVQTNEFTPRTKALLLAILKFTKLLLENATNRKLFASLDRLNCLLNTTDSQVLLATLRLALRPAQLFSGAVLPPSWSFGISDKRLLDLAQSWGTREHGLDMADIATDSVKIPQSMQEVDWQFYKQAPSQTKRDNMNDESEDVSTPAVQRTRPFFSANASAPSTPGPSTVITPGQPSNEGLTAVHLGNVSASPNSAANILLDAIEVHGIPESDRLSLLHKIRIAESLSNAQDRQDMLVVRLLSVAIFAHVSTESAIQSKLLLYEPEVVAQIAELVHPEKQIPVQVQAAALYTLEAFARMKSKLSEVTSALNAGVSHGILMYIMRRTGSDLEQGQKPPSTSPEFVDALFHLLTYLASVAHIGNMIIGAGIVAILVDFANVKRSDRAHCVTKAIAFLDSLAYGYTSAFNLFLAADGHNVFVKRAEAEVTAAIEKHGDTESEVEIATGQMPYQQAALLKSLLRGLQRMMQTFGTTEGLRNMIDSPLLATCKAIMEHPRIFGHQIFALAINIMATFVHNEPTCLATVQESKAPLAFYDAIEKDIPASLDVLQAIPNAIGALCLNSTGLDQFNARLIIPKYFEVFSSDKHVRILSDRENATVLGASIDELVRHHPSLRTKVLQQAEATLQDIQTRARSFDTSSLKGYRLQSHQPATAATTTTTADEDVKMEPAASISTAPATDDDVAYADNDMLPCIDVYAKFLESFAQNPTHARELAKQSVVSHLMDLYLSPCIPIADMTPPALAAITSLLRTLGEVRCAMVMEVLVGQLRTSVIASKDIYSQGVTKDSVFSAYFEPPEGEIARLNARVRALSRLWKVFGALHELVSTISWSHNKAGTAMLLALMGEDGREAIAECGAIYRFAVWQDSLVPVPGGIEERVAQMISKTPAERAALARAQSETPPVQAQGENQANASGAPAAPAADSTPSTETQTLTIPSEQEVKDMMKKRPHNVKMIHSILHLLCVHVTSLVQGISDMLVHRRLGDVSHRTSAWKMSGMIADFLKVVLARPDSQDSTKITSYFSTVMSTAVNPTLMGAVSASNATSTTLKTLTAVGFVKNDGLAAVFDVYSYFVEELEKRKLKIEAGDLPLGGKNWVPPPMTAILDLLRRLVTAKAWHESAQSAILLSRERNSTIGDHFEPDVIIIKVRLEVLQLMQNSWSSTWIKYAGSEAVRKIASMILTILSADGEKPVEPIRPAANALDMLAGGPGAGGGLQAGGLLQTLLGGMGLAAGGVGGAGAARGGGPFQVDETRVNQLVDMGFPRQAARTALARSRNNVDFATEYLLSHPDIVGAAEDAELAGLVDDAPAAQNDQNGEDNANANEPAGAAEADNANEPEQPPSVDHPSDDDSDSSDGDSSHRHDDEDAAMQDVVRPSTNDDEANDRSSSLPAPEDENKERAKKLDEARKEVKKTFLSTALAHAEEYPDLIFDVKGSFSKFMPDGSSSRVALISLLQAVGDAPQSIPDDREKMVLTRLRLTALLAADPAYLDVTKASQPDIISLVDRCHKAYTARDPSPTNRPVWLAAAMLVAEIVLAMSETPKLVAITDEESSSAANPAEESAEMASLRKGYLAVGLDLLRKGVSDKETFISLLHTLLVTTRDHALAKSFVDQDGHKLLYQLFKSENEAIDSHRLTAAIVLRHIVETPEILRHILEREIEQWFASQPRNKVTDVQAFLRGTSSLAFRNVPLFIEAVRSTCKITNPDALSQYIITSNKLAAESKKNASTETKAEPADQPEAATADVEMAGDSKQKPTATLPVPPVEVDSVAQFLLGEICQSYKTAMQPSKLLSESEAAEKNIDIVKEGESSTEGIPLDTPLDAFQYTALMMATLGELVASYAPAKAALLSYSARRCAGEQSGTILKTRASFLYFLLNEVIPLESISSSSTFEAKKHSIISNKAMDIVIALCHDPDRSAGSDVAVVRKSVLDTIAKALKDATTSTEPTAARYGRLLGLSELCSRLLTTGPFMLLPKQDDQLMQIAKLMLEKNFAVILTNALAEIDLNFPSVSHLINAILKPLEQLSKVVTKVGRAKGSEASPPDHESVTEEEAFFSEDFDEDTDDLDDDVMIGDEDEDGDVNEGPDLYRNSALGMYEGELEPGVGEDQYMSEGTGEDYDEEEEMMEDLDDVGLDGTDVSDLSEDEGPGDFPHDDEDMMSEGTGTESDLDDEDVEDYSEGEMLDEDDIGDVLELADGPIEEEIVDVVEGEPEGDEWVDEDEEQFEGEEQPRDEIGRRLNELAEDLRNNDAIPGDEDDGFSDEGDMYLHGELEFDEGLDEPFPADARGNRSIWEVLDSQVDEAGGRPFDSVAGGRNGNAAAEAAAHPLLVDRPATDARTDSTRSRRPRRAAGSGNWLQSIEDMIGAGAVEALQDLLGSHGLDHAGVDQVRLQINTGPEGGLAVVVDPTAIRQNRDRGALTALEGRASSSAPTSNSPQALRNKLYARLDKAAGLKLLSTAQRCHEELKLVMTGILSSDRVARLVNHVVNALLPAARESARQEKVKAEKEKAEKDERERKAAEEKKAAEAAAPREKPDDSLADDTFEAPSAAETQQDDAMEDVEPQDDVAEVINLARSLAAGLAVPSSATPRTDSPAVSQEPPAASSAAPTPSTSAPAVSTSTAAAVPSASTSEAGPSNAPPATGEGQPRPRVTTMVHGNEVDITDTGIDPEFLEALPDDMREEVINQHFRETQATRPATTAPGSLSNEFLNALPPTLRAEVMRTDSAAQARGAANEPRGPVDMDAASFLATLDPALREAVLLEQDDELMQGLPPAIAAEAGVLRQRRPRASGSAQARPPAVRAQAEKVDSDPKATTKEVIQLLDKAGLATLVRLLFFPQPLRRHSLQKVLTNLCENLKTRADLVHMLLAILQHGTQDVSAVDKSFNQMSIRASKALPANKDTPKRKLTDTPGGPLPHFPSENVPNLIAQRCIEALGFLVGANSRTALFFLTEQDMSLVLNKKASKKGKSKEKPTPSLSYPIASLLGLLERESMLKTQSMLDAYTNLVAAITKPLANIPSLKTEVELRKRQLAKDEGDKGSTAETSKASPSKDVTPERKEHVLIDNPPQLSEHVLRLIVNILDTGECSSRTFSQTLTIIQNLSYLENVKSTIAKELQTRAQDLAKRLEPELIDLQHALEGEGGVSSTTLAKFSPASSLQARLLRVLKTIDWIHSPSKKTHEPFDLDNRKLTEDEEKMREIYESFDFGGLWTHVGDCLTRIEDKPDLLYVATVLLPLIESLMVVSKFVGPSKAIAQAVPAVTPSVEMRSPRMRELGLDPQEARFLKFTEDHRKVLNTMVRNNPSLMSGSFAVLVHNPKILEFDNKRSYFFSRLHDRSQRRGHFGTLQVNVRRQHVFEDSFRILQRKKGDEVKYGKLNVKFYEEEGVDAGGVTREWFSVLARQMFNPGYALFQPQAADAQIYQPNKASSINPDHLSFFSFVGRIIGKALYDQRILEAYFSRAVYKHMLGKPVDHRDLESIDPEFHKSLVWMLENDIEGVLDLTFSVERDDFGVIEIVDMIPNGRNIAVTNENKAEYVRRIADQRLSIEIKDQMEAMLKGLYEIVPKNLLRIFTERELELLISGLPEIDVDEWRANTVLQNFSTSDPVIGYFWRAVRSFSQEERAKLLQFVTGSSRVPLEGFGSLQGMQGVTKFTIVNAGNKKGLPTAHTCFNSLELTCSWESYDDFRQTLLYAINEGATGFGFA